jgi:aminoglycoside phosphotransferase (APT) family kinase protein
VTDTPAGTPAPDPAYDRAVDRADDRAVDPAGLAAYLAANLPERAGTFEIERLGEGQSCLTFLIRGDGWDVVLRRPPRGDLPPTAFDVSREYRVMHALDETHAPVPVPRVLAFCEDRRVIGAPFYLMERVDGVVVRDELPVELRALGDRRRMAEQLLDTLVALREVDSASAGLELFGRPDGYLERQLWRMRGLWDLARFRDVPRIEELGAWLADRLPDRLAPAIVHGDYKLDNVIFAPAPPATLVAVVDWEMSTLGDPLADLGWLLFFWRDPGDPGFGLRVATVTDQPGFPRRHELLERYVSKTEPAGLDGPLVRWYTALAGWKIAIIMEGSYRRFLGGVGDHPAFAQLEHAVPALAQRAWEAANGTLAL